MSETTNYSLYKPSISESGWGAAVSANFDTIDETMKANEDLAHAILHDIDSTDDHTGVSGAVEDNFLSFDANGLPQDSGVSDATYADATHASGHASGGGDEVNGDIIDIDWNPDNSTPTVVEGVSTTVDHLTSHLKGIDLALADAGHARLHDIDSALDHTGVSGAVEDNLVSFDDAGLPKDSGAAASSVHSPTDYRTIIIDGGGAAVTTGRKPCFSLPVGTIVSVTAYSDQSTSSVIDIWKTTYTAYDNSTHPVDGDSITAAAPVTLTTANKAQDATLTDWDTDIAENDNFTLNVDSNDNATWIALTFKITLS